jgi:hypothetical protein
MVTEIVETASDSMTVKIKFSKETIASIYSCSQALNFNHRTTLEVCQDNNASTPNVTVKMLTSQTTQHLDGQGHDLKMVFDTLLLFVDWDHS